jgi:hypothetical protein
MTLLGLCTSSVHMGPLALNSKRHFSLQISQNRALMVPIL